MVSMQQTSLSLEERKSRAMTNLDQTLLSSKKRKWEEEEEEEEEEGGGNETAKSFKFAETKTCSSSDRIELQLDTPLPVEWQRCLDIKSGQIHFYNTRTRRRTSEDPSHRNPNPNRNPEPCLDLELNLTCGCGAGEEVDDGQEMVAGVCVRCHMLVMMCKAAPSCPNCKFVHPTATGCSSSLLKTGSGLFLCCKD